MNFNQLLHKFDYHNGPYLSNFFNSSKASQTMCPTTSRRHLPGNNGIEHMEMSTSQHLTSFGSFWAIRRIPERPWIMELQSLALWLVKVCSCDNFRFRFESSADFWHSRTQFRSIWVQYLSTKRFWLHITLNLAILRNFTKKF